MITTIVDLSHHNKDIDLAKAQSAGLAAVIHKASQGVSFIDSKFYERASICRELAIPFGAYHYGNGQNGIAQAKHFLNVCGDSENILKILDIEINPSGDTIDLKTAEDFVKTVYREIGLWPGLYSNTYLFEMTKGVAESPLYSCWLWCADYQSQPVVPPSWSVFKLWQYTNGKAGLAEAIDGIGFCDRSKFYGSPTELLQFWHRSK